MKFWRFLCASPAERWTYLDALKDIVEAQTVIHNLTFRTLNETDQRSAEIVRLQRNNAELYRAFRHKMDRKAKCEYRSRLQLENEVLRAEYQRVLDENMRLLELQ